MDIEATKSPPCLAEWCCRPPAVCGRDPSRGPCQYMGRGREAWKRLAGAGGSNSRRVNIVCTWCRLLDRSWYPSAMSGHRYQSGFSAATPDDGLWLGCACRCMEAWRRTHAGGTLSSFSPSTSPLSRYQIDLLLLLFLLLETVLHMAGRHTRTCSRGIRTVHGRISLFMATRTTPSRQGIRTYTTR